VEQRDDGSDEPFSKKEKKTGVFFDRSFQIRPESIVFTDSHRYLLVFDLRATFLSRQEKKGDIAPWARRRAPVGGSRSRGGSDRGTAAFTATGAGLPCDFRPNPPKIQILVFLRFASKPLRPLDGPAHPRGPVQSIRSTRFAYGTHPPGAWCYCSRLKLITENALSLTWRSPK
jgi:hypothetical protein